MPNILDQNGLQVKDLSEIRQEIIDDLKVAYGDDINVDQDTPDGQAINIFALAVKDTLDVLTQVYSSFDPDQAIGRALDDRASINGIQRLAGTHTTTPVLVETDRALNLIGLDSNLPENSPANVFTVSDSEGNYFYLTNSQTIAVAGFNSFSFTAKEIGAIQTAQNQINKLVTTVLGVKSVNNPDITGTVTGLNEETDAALRLRRQKSVSLASQGYLQSLEAELQNISGVVYSKVYENTSSATDSDGIPSHSIWVIVEGGSDSNIGYAIYTKRNAGCGMKGAVIVDVTRPDGSIFQVKFDRTQTQNLYVKFDAHSISGIVLDTTYIKEQLALRIALGVGDDVNTNDVASLIREIDPNCLATSIKVSSNGSDWFDIIGTSAKNNRFVLLSSNVTITVV